MSLPIRQGKLFPGVEKASKKFGRHLATFKYKLLLSPLFIAHIYKHKDAEDYADDVVAATGLKLRIDSFMLDLHQRREEFNIAAGSKTKGRAARTSAMKINEVQLDLITADLRAISAIIKGTSQEEISKASDADIASYQQQSALTPDISRFTIPDNDFLWIDMDDFVEPDWILPAETHPETKIMPLAFAPRFNYFRQTDHANNISGDPSRSSPFGKEPTHFCIMSQDNDPRRVQYDLMRDRVAAIDAQIDIHRHSMGEQGLRVVRDGVQDGNLKTHQEQMASQRKILEDKRDFMYHMLQHMLKRMENKTPLHAGEEAIEISQDGSEAFPSASSTHSKDSKDMDDAISFEQDFPADFNNRFIAHNIQLKWNNSLRNVILRYVHQVSQRRGFVYYMSRRAVKFILDIVEEQMKTRHKDGETSTQRTPTSPTSSSKSFFEDDQEDDSNLEERIEQILKGENTVNVEDSHIPRISVRQDTSNMDHDIAEEFIPQNSYHVRLIAPQIQLQSEKNPKAVLLVTAKGMQLKVLQIMDKSRLQDDVSGLVQRRFSLDMEGAQFFVAHQKNLAQYLQLYSANRYGMPKGSSWPPWVPVEVNFDFQFNPAGFARVVQKTSASLRYDKYNTLRLKYNDELSRGDTTPSHAVDDPETRIDHLWVEFPQIRAACDSAQYYAMYLIVVDLLLYTEPLEKVRSERLEKIMLAADFSDLTGAPEMVISLQERIRQLEEIKAHFQLNAKYLDRQGWLDRLVIERDITGCEDELFFMMKAITTSQRKYDDRSQSSQNGLLRWYLSASDIVWHLMREKNEPLIEIQLKNATYDRTDNSDGSNNNTMEIARLHGLNLLPNTLYPEMLAPYFENSHAAQTRNDEDIKMLKVQWIMLEAIAGIPVLDQFEVNLFPLKIQLEREVGKKLFDYVFPGGPEGGASPFMIKHKMNVQDDDDDDSDGDLQLSNTSSPAMTYEEPQQSTRAGSLELRLRPTLNLSESSRPKTSTAAMREGTPSSNDSHRFKFFASGNRPNAHRSLSLNRSHTSLRPVSQRNVSHKSSDDSLRSLRRSMGDSSSTSLAGMNSAERSSRFRLNRSASSNSTLDTSSSKDTAKASDDLSQMLSRASNYMTLSYVKIPSVVLCLSYKGKGERNIEDVHDFVFRMPNLEYRNKTWSNLDLALRLKKDVIRALISHTGAIIGNKLSHHRPNKTQQSRLRQIANTSILSPNADSLTNNLSNVARRGTMRGTRSTSPIRRTGSELSTYQTSETSSSLSFGAASSGRTSNSTRSSSPNGKVSLPSRGKSFVTSSLKQFASSSRSGHISEEPDELDVPHPTSKDSASPQREQTNGDAHSTEAEHSLFGPGSLTRRLTGGAKSIGSRHRESLFAASNNLDIPPVPAVPSTFTTNGSNGRVHRGSTGDEKESRPGSEGDSNGILLHAVEKARSHNDETPSTNGTAAGYEGGKRREDEIGSNPSSGSTGLQGNRSRKASVIHLGKKILGTLN
ncbi:hypothetical protein MMC25_004889 [Agyrium rufum]|nr:hypothetical protein [Agyrium rufum]